MDNSLSSSQSRQRLVEIANEAGVSSTDSKSISKPITCPTYVTKEDEERAYSLLTHRRETDPHYKAPKRMLGLGKPKVPPFDYKEATRALVAVAEENGSLGLVEALMNMVISLGGDVNVSRKATENFAKKIIRKDKEEVRSGLLAKATHHGNTSMVQLLATKSDQVSLDEALPIAILKDDLEKTKILLQEGANPEEFHDEFMTVVKQTKEDMVELLLLGPKLPCGKCRSECLVKAVETGSLRNVSLLLLQKADADFENALALQKAIRVHRNDLAAAIVLSGKPSSASLDAAVALAYADTTRDLTNKTALIEMCLCGGAQGDNVAETLFQAIRQGQTELIDLLLLHKASVDYSDGVAIRQAVETQQIPILIKLLGAHPSTSALSKGVTSATNLSDLDKAYEILELLLNAGAIGDAISQALITAVQLRPNPQTYKIIQLLLDPGMADVDFETGKAIQIVIEAGVMNVLQLLLARKPALPSLGAAFPLAMNIQDVKTKYQTVEMLLRAGSEGATVDEALVKSAKEGASSVSLSKLLLTKASVNYENGKALCEAVKVRCFELVEVLATGKPPSGILRPTTLTAVWAEGVILQDNELDFQFKVFQILLQHGMSGEPVNQTLVNAVMKGTPSLALCKLLVQRGASVDFEGGSPLIIAVQKGFVDTLEVLLSVQPAKPSLTQALRAARKLNGEEQLAMVSRILAAGVDKEVRDSGLLEAVKEQPIDIRLIQLFLDAEASPDFSDGACILHAADVFDLDLFCLLSRTATSKDSFTKAFQVIIDSQKQWNTAEGLRFVKILVEKGATGEPVDYVAVTAAETLNIDALRLVADSVTSAAVFDRAFDGAIEVEDVWLLSEGLATIQLLLERGVSGPSVEDALCDAAEAFSLDALDLLVTAVQSADCYTMAFGKAVGASDQWLLPEGLDVIELLLEQGAGGEVLHITFLEAVNAYVEGNASEALIDVLLFYHADVNYENGYAVQFAASIGDIPLLRKFLFFGANQESISTAFSMAIVSLHQDKHLLSIIDTFMENEAVRPDLNFVCESMDSPLFLCLQQYPESVALLERMCEIGFNLEHEIEYNIYIPEESKSEIVVEMVTVLAWAIDQPESFGSAIVAVLIKSKANINYVTKICRFSALILAAKHGRTDVVLKLLQHGAKATTRDKFDRTALFYAASKGDTKSVHGIVKRKPGTNDGSLQEAARELHVPAIKLLLKAGHNPDFPSPKHDRRTALAELCLRCDSTKDSSLIALAIDALVAGKADPLKKYRGKTAMFLTLENPDPFLMTQKLIEQLYWQYINHEANIYAEDDVCYSPTMYISKGFLPVSEEERDRLIKLLEDCEAVDRYYVKEGQEQPPDAIGIPEKIVEFERKKQVRKDKRRKEDEDHWRQLEREMESAKVKAQIRQASHEQAIAHNDELSSQKQQSLASTKMLELSLKETADEYNARAALEKHASKLQQEQELDAQKLQTLQMKIHQNAAANRQRLETQKQLKIEELRAQASASQLKLQTQAQSNQLAAAASQNKLHTQMQANQLAAAASQNKLHTQAQSNQLAIAAGTAKARAQSQSAMIASAAGQTKLHQAVQMQQIHTQGEIQGHGMRMQELASRKQNLIASKQPVRKRKNHHITRAVVGGLVKVAAVGLLGI